MSISYVQSNVPTSGGTTQTCAYLSDNTAGNFLVVVVRLTNGSGASSVTDSQGNTWTKATEITNGSSIASIWYSPNCKAGANTVTVKRVTNTVFIEFCIGEYSGIVLTSPSDQTPVQAGPTTSNSGSVGPLTPGVSPNLCIGMFCNETANNLTLTEGGGFAKRNASNGNVVLLDKIQGSPTAATATCGFSSSVNWVGLLADFKGTGGPNSLMLMGAGT